MIASESLPIPLITKGEVRPNIKEKRTGIPLHDVRNVMETMPIDLRTAESIDCAKILADTRVRPTDTIEDDPVCLTIQQNSKTYIVGTLGNLSTMSGRAKAKKTFAVSFAVAAAVANMLVLNRIKGYLPEDKRTVLLFDTEQSKHHVLKVVKRICRLCEIDDPSNLMVHSLRPYSPEDRLKVIDYALNNTPNIGLAVIDGVRDLAVDPVLDAEQASHIMTHLLQWTDRLNIHIMCVLHQNKNDTNLRGHLGTELVNKSETVISVTKDSKDKEVSHVEAEYCRNREFDPFCFSVDDTGMPYLVDEETDEERTKIQLSKYAKANRSTADTLTAEIVKAIVDRSFSQEAHLGYSQLRTAIMEASEFVGASLSKNRAEQFIERIIKRGFIVKFKPEKSRYEAYQLVTNSDPFQPS